MSFQLTKVEPEREIYDEEYLRNLQKGKFES